MPCGTFTVTDIPSDQVGGVIAEFNLDNPTSVTKTQQANGLWQVVAVFPACPPDQPQTNTKTFGS